MSAREVSTETRDLLRAAISNAYYEARNAGRTMEHAADAAVEALVPILLSCDANAHARGAVQLRDEFRREVDASADGVWREAIDLLDQLAPKAVVS